MIKMWNGKERNWTLVLFITSCILFVATLSSPTPKTSTASSSLYSRRINLRSKSAANLHLQTLRSSRQIPSPPALYSAPKEREQQMGAEAKAQVPPPIYGPPEEASMDESSATTEMVTEDALEGASTSAPESEDAEVVESENEVSSGTERTDYLPPSPPTTKRRRPKDQQMVESNPFGQIQIHVVPPHLSQDDHNSDILGTSYGIPEIMMASHPVDFSPSIRGQYLPPQGREAQPPPQISTQQESYGPQTREGDVAGDNQPRPSTEYQTPRRDEPEREQPNTQIYQVPTAYSSPSTDVQQQQQQQQYSTTPSGHNSNPPQIQNQGQQLDGYPQNQGYQTTTTQEGQRQQPSFSRNQLAQNFQQGYSQPQQLSMGQSQEGYPQGQSYPFNFNYNQNTVMGDYPSINYGDYRQQMQQSYQPQQQQAGYSQNQVTHEEQQDDAIVIQGFSSPKQTQPQYSQNGYPSLANIQNHATQSSSQGYTQSSQPSQQSFQSQEMYSQNQSPPQSQHQYEAPQSGYEPQRYPSADIVPQGYSQQQKIQFQSQPQTYDQQSRTSNMRQTQPQTSFQNTPTQYDSKGYPESRPQPQQNNPSAPTQPQTVSNPQAQYFQGNFFPQAAQPAQPQFRSNSLEFDSSQDEELEGLDGRIVDAALLARVQQIIEEHERQQKSLLANFNSNAPAESPSYVAPVPQQQTYQPISQTPIATGNLESVDQYQQQPQQGFGQTSNPGIQYQKAILSQQFTETTPINSQTSTPQPEPNVIPHSRQQSSPQNDAQVENSQTQGLRLIPSPQLGPSQVQGRDNDIPKPVYGVPLANVIGLDSNENFKVVDDLPQQYGQNSFNTAPLTNNFLQPQQAYGRNRRRVAGRVIKLNNSSPRISIPYFV